MLAVNYWWLLVLCFIKTLYSRVLTINDFNYFNWQFLLVDS